MCNLGVPLDTTVWIFGELGVGTQPLAHVAQNDAQGQTETQLESNPTTFWNQTNSRNFVEPDISFIYIVPLPADI